MRVSELTITIKGVFPGSATVTVTAWDPSGLMASLDIEVMVPNRAPVALGTLPSVKTVEEGVWATWADEAFEDPDGQSLTFSASSANSAIATAEIVDSIQLHVRGVALGTTTVTVTATDPGGLSATLDLEVEVLEPVLVFRDDFDSSASLDDWTLYSYSSWSVDDGKLWLEGFATREASAIEWEFKGAMGVDGEDTYTGLYSFNRGTPLIHIPVLNRRRR